MYHGWVGLSQDVIELRYYDNIDNASEKLKDSSVQAYINLHGSFQGIVRVTGSEIANVISELVKKSIDRCYFHRLSFKRNGEWDELLLVLCGDTVIASYGEVEGKEEVGVKSLEKIVKNINEDKYTHGIIEMIEVPLKLVENKLGVKVEALAVKEKEEKEEVKEEKLVAEEKPPEIERFIEGAEAVATIPVETSVSKTEMLPEEKREIPPETAPALGLPPTIPKREEKPRVEEAPTRKPMVLEEVVSLDKSMLELSDRLINLASSENVNISNVVVQGDPDRLEVEMIITKLGWSKKRNKMLNIANSVADVLSDVLIKNRAPQRELVVTVRHGYNAVKIVRRLKS